MELNKEFVLREVAGNWVVLPVGQAGVNFNGMISLNETGAFIAEKLLHDTGKEELVALLRSEYEVDVQTAHNAGMLCLSVLWGFRTREYLAGEGATHFCDHPKNLVKCLKEMIEHG